MKPFPCTICGKRFRHPKLLSSHTAFSHGREEPHLSCDFCSRQFAQLEALQSHRLRHTVSVPAHKYKYKISFSANQTPSNEKTRKIGSS